MTWRGIQVLAGEVAWRRLPRQAQASLMATAMAQASALLADGEPIRRAWLVMHDGRACLVMTTEGTPE